MKCASFVMFGMFGHSINSHQHAQQPPHVTTLATTPLSGGWWPRMSGRGKGGKCAAKGKSYEKGRSPGKSLGPGTPAQYDSLKEIASNTQEEIEKLIPRAVSYSSLMAIYFSCFCSLFWWPDWSKMYRTDCRQLWGTSFKCCNSLTRSTQLYWKVRLRTTILSSRTARHCDTFYAPINGHCTASNLGFAACFSHGRPWENPTVCACGLRSSSVALDL